MTIFGSLFTPSATRAVRGALEQLVGEAWAMEPSHLHRFVERLAASVEGANVLEHEAARRAAFPVDEGPGYTVDGGVAVVPVRGVILRTVPGWFAWFDVSATSTVRTREALSAALDDPSVDGIVLAVDSPGGTVSGLQELADAVHAVRGKKPIVAQVDGLCASAAYWIASQADAIHATADSLSGSIGVYRVAYDYSRMLDAAGVRTNVISSHPLKGAGVFGAPLTDAQREEVLAAAELRAWAESLAPGSWVGVDFDRTLCTYDGEWREGRIVGDPIAPMVERVRRWLAAGVDVRIFTARANQEDQHAQIEAWCLAHLGRFLPVTATKDWRMVEAWDDAMVSVERGTGRRLAPSCIPGERSRG